MALYTKKKDVERYVKELLSKVKTDDERKLKGFTIARMYHQVGDHRTARQYLTWYLEARPAAAPAHKLLGQVLAASGEPAMALSAFDRSLELDSHQKDLVMIGCKLLLELPSSTHNSGRWLEQAIKYFKTDPIVVKLRQHLRGAVGQSQDGEDIDKLLAAELAADPTDPGRHVRLSERLVVSSGPAEAARYVRQVEERRPFPRSIDWYRCVADICQKYQCSVGSPDTSYQLLRLEALDRLVALGLDERQQCAEITANLYRLDQLLLQVSRDLEAAGEPQQQRLETAALVSHITGQLFYHMGSVLLLGSVQGVGEAAGGGSREASDMALALFLAAQAYPPLETVSSLYQASRRQATLDAWRRQAGARQVEVGWAVLAAESNNKPDHVLRVQQQLCSQKGRSRIHSRVFRSGSVSGLGRTDTSAFLTLPAFLETNPLSPRSAELLPLASLFWQEHGGRLQQAVWLRLRAPGAGYQPPVGLVLPLQARGAVPDATAAPETLCLIDVLAFLEATVYVTSQLRMAAGGRPAEDLLPPAVAGRLCTEDQSGWWSALHLLQGGAAPAQELAGLRRRLQRGLEAVRCLSGHGSSVRLVMHLAHWALQQAVDGRLDQTAAYEARAELYLRAALPMLERLQRGVVVESLAKQRLFDTGEPDPEPSAADALRDEACRLLAGLLQRRGRLDEALALVTGLPSADAAYQHGVILHQLAVRPDAVDSAELLRQSLESFYLTLDRLRDPVGSGTAQLSREDLAAQIREVERLTAEQQAGAATHVNGTCSAEAVLERSLTSRWQSTAGSRTSTPRRPTAAAAAAASPHNLSNSFGQEARPSMERLCAELQGLKMAMHALPNYLPQPPSQAEQPDHGQQRRRELRELQETVSAAVHSALADELAQLRQEMKELRREMVEQGKQRRETAPPPQPQSSAGHPEVFGYLAALAGMQRSVAPMMPMGLASPMMYPAASPFQGVSLHDTSLQSPAMPAASDAHQRCHGDTPNLPAPPLPSAPPLPPAPPEQLPSVPSVPSVPSAPPAPSAPAVQPVGVSFFSSRPPATNTSSKLPAGPANVTMSSREPLPAASAAGPAAPPSVVVPLEHIKPQVVTPQKPATVTTAAPATAAARAGGGDKSPHQFQIQLPSNAQLNVASPLDDSDKPAFSKVSTLPNIPAPQFSAICPPQQAGRSPGRDRLDSTGSFHEDPEYEPMADFKPVVALPEEVEIRTGEEGDTPLFTARCKLFRFTGDEWKERGVGQLRILHRTDDGRVRLVMRRDQTHKVCANHFLQPGMELNSMKGQPRAVIWAAKDFADEELKDERLCARFKTEDEVEQFRTAFQKGKELVAAACGKNTPSKSPVETTFSSPPKRTPAVFPTAPAAAPANWAPVNIPSVVAAGDDDNAEEDDDDLYETEEEETTSEEEDDEEPMRIACKPAFNFAGATKASSSFSFGFGGAGAAPVASTVVPSTGFKFGDKAPAAGTATTFGFGFGKTTPAPAPVSGTPTADSGRSTGATGGFRFGQSPAAPPASGAAAGAAANTTEFKFGQGLTSVSFTTTTSGGASATPASKASLGGFSFTTTPTIKKPEPAPAAAATASQSESKPSPFAGFSFGAAAQDRSLGSLSFAAASDGGPGFKKDDSFKGFAGSGAPVFGSSPTKAADGDDADTADEEYEPSAHFEPVVPLPDLVETKTGEEADEKLFSHRAKLYRMDATTKEWKERGIGEIKILKNRDTGKCRVLMRREQVLKLCANHIILPEMALSPLQSSQSAWVWSANDFSEGEASQETLAVRFKTPELAAQFREVFESCQAPPASGTAPGPARPARSDAPAASVPAAGATTSSASATSAADPPARGSFVFGSGTPSNASGQFHFSGVKPKSPVKPSRSRDASLNESAGGEDNEYYQGDEGEHLLFEPVIPLPDKVEVKTGEEDEQVLYSHRAKLYRFAKETGEWKERGLGDIKLLEHRQTHKVRLLMRREQVLKICLNHRVTAQLELKMKDDRSAVWAATDHAEPEPRDDMFVARFKTPEVAAEFVAAVQKAQGGAVASPAKASRSFSTRQAPSTQPSTGGAAGTLAAAAQSPSIFGGGTGASPGSGFSFGGRFDDRTPSAPENEGPSASFTFRLPGAADDDSDSDEVVIVGEVQPTAEQRAAAGRLQLPAGFYLYQQRPACSGCRGCRDQLPGESKDQYAGGESAGDSGISGPVGAGSSCGTPAAAAAAAASPSSFQFKAASFAFGGDQTKSSESAPKATFAFGASSAAASPFKFSVGDDANRSTSLIFGGPSTQDTKPAPLSIFGGGASTSETNTPSIFGSPSVFGGTDKPVAMFGGIAAGDKPMPSESSTDTKPDSNFGGLGKDTKSGSIFGGADGKTFGFALGGGGGWPMFGAGKAAPATEGGGAQADTAAADPPGATFGLGLQSGGTIIDFASLASKGGQPAGAKADPSFQFSGAGKAVFGGSASAERGGSDGEEADDSAHDPHFEPIVPLPELVSVKTGEEDEQQVFCHRAILYRFNKDTSEWKERGRGDFKLLHNTRTGSYRVLLRREQVHKLACNHRVRADMVLTRLGTSDQAWIWSAMDYADEEPKAETFAVKFKTEALANEYKKAFESAVQKLGEAPASSAQAESGTEDGAKPTDDEDEDDLGPMFEKHATLHTDTGDVWKPLGSGELQVIYDDDLYGVRILMEADNTEGMLCDVFITMQHKYLLDGKTVTWTAMDYALDPPLRRTLRVSFDTDASAGELAHSMDEAVEIARGSGIGDTEEAAGAAASADEE